MRLPPGPYTAEHIEPTGRHGCVNTSGRPLAAGVPFEETQLSLKLGDFLLYEKGTPLPFAAAAVSAYMKANRDLTMRLTFTLGAGRCTFYTCDLTYDYVRLNADYTT